MGPRSPTTELSAGPRGGETRPDQRAEGKDQPLEVLRHVPIESIVPNSQQPRTDWEPEGLKELARSISANGLLEPIIVRTVGDRYEIVAGERRWRACKIAGWLEIPAIVRSCEDKESLQVALVENVQRSDLNPVDEARAYKALSMEYELTHDEIANQVGKDRSTVTNLVRILNLSDSMLGHVSRGTLSTGHARVLLSVPDEHRPTLAQRIIDESWSVRAAEAWAKRLAKGLGGTRQGASRGQRKSESLQRIEEELCRRFSAEVRIRVKRQGGKLEFRYHDDEDLSRLLDLLGVAVC